MSRKKTNASRRGGVYQQREGVWIGDYTVWTGGKRERIRRTLKATTEQQAWDEMAELRRQRIERGARPDPARTSFANLAERLFTEYEALGRPARTLKRLHQLAARLEQFFAHDNAEEIRERLTSYIVHRRRQSAAPASIRFELWTLARMFRVAKLEPLAVPAITVENTREGFLDRAAFEKVRKHLPVPLQALATFAYITGWRRGECVGLAWRQVDFDSGVVRLEARQTKNRKPREWPFAAHPELRELLEAQHERTEAL